MKKIFLKFLSVFCIACSIFTTSAQAAGGEGWYLIKHKGTSPNFPKNAEFLREHSCYFIDEEASKSGERVLYLTFDAGYENGNIGRIMDILRSEGVPAAFFILSNLINKNEDLVERMFEEGHTVCNHTSNHKNLTKMSKSEARENLEALESLCYEKTGYTMSKYFRYPEGYYSKDTALFLEELGYKTFFWSMAYADWDNGRQPSPDAAIENLMAQTHPGAVILLHPTSKTNADILPTLIERWREMGYKFASLGDLINNCK